MATSDDTSNDAAARKSNGTTQLDVMMALRPESALDYDLHNGGLRFGGRKIFIRETGELEYPYGDSTFIAALVTAKHLEYALASKIRNARVLELGAGTGTLGLVAAALGAKRVLLTDLECSMKQLLTNVALNEKEWTKTSTQKDDDDASATKDDDVVERVYTPGTLEVKELDWFKAEDVTALGSFDFILGSELMFDEDLLPPLVNVLKLLTDANPNAVILLGYQDRLLVDDDDIDGAFAPLFDSELVEPEEMHPDFRVRACKDLRIYRMKRKRRSV
eukprot:g352.t1